MPVCSTPSSRSSLTNTKSRIDASGGSGLQRLQSNRLRPSFPGVRHWIVGTCGDSTKRPLRSSRPRNVLHRLKPRVRLCHKEFRRRIEPQPLARREQRAVLRIGYDLLRLRLLHPGCRTPALHCLVSDHLQRKDKCCEVPPRQNFVGCTLKLRKRGRRARHKDRGPHRFRDKDRLLLPLWNLGRKVLNPRLRGRAGHPGLPSLHGPLYWLHRTVYTL